MAQTRVVRRGLRVLAEDSRIGGTFGINARRRSADFLGANLEDAQNPVGHDSEENCYTTGNSVSAGWQVNLLALLVQRSGYR